MVKRKNSKKKGNRGEREVKKLLQDWWQVDCEFHRTPQSGGFHTLGGRITGFDLEGDITCTDPKFPFSVEVKYFENWNLENLLTAPKSDIFKYWDQTLGQTPDGKIPMMFFRRNRMPWFVITDRAINTNLSIAFSSDERATFYITTWEEFCKTPFEEWLDE